MTSNKAIFCGLVAVFLFALEGRAVDAFCDRAAWARVSVHQDLLSVRFGVPYRGEPSMVVSNVVGQQKDTAWVVRSVRKAVPPEARFVRVSFKAAADRVIMHTNRKGAWHSSMLWYDAKGQFLSREAWPVMSVGRRFTPFVFVFRIPVGAVQYAMDVGFDIPNILPKQGVAFTALDCRFSAEEPPDEPLPELDRFEPEVAFTPPQTEAGGFSFVVSDASALAWDALTVAVDGQDVTAALSRNGNRVTFAQPRTPWSKGLHKVAIRIADVAENLACSDKYFYIGPRPAGTPDCRLRADGMTLVDGKAFFPVGIYGVCKRAFNGKDLHRACADLKAGGFNLIQSYVENTNPAFFKAARENGIMTLCEFSAPNARFMDFQRDDASCLARYTGDDTSWHLSQSVMLDRHENAKAVDHGRLTAQADGVGTRAAPKYRPYVKYTDIFLPELYPVSVATDGSNCVAQVIDAMKIACEDIVAVKDAKPHGLWPIIQYFQGWESWKRFPTREELFAMSFAALVHGANGIFWYTYGGWDEDCNYGVTTTPERWANITNLATRISALAPVLLSEEGGAAQPNILSGPRQDALGHASVTALWKRWDGKTYLIAVNGTRETVRASFDMRPTGSGDGGVVAVAWEHRNLDRQGALFEDTFAPLAVHVYRW